MSSPHQADPGPAVDFVVPLYRSAENIETLFERVNQLIREIGRPARLILVLDGPDVDTESQISAHRTKLSCPVRIIRLSRNFGVAAALNAGMANAMSPISICMGSDLQEPASFFVEAVTDVASGSFDVVLGGRKSRQDPFLHKIGASLYWRMVRRALGDEIPRGGFDVFAVNAAARSALTALPESGANITTQIFWIGFRRKFILFDRVARARGRSSWTVARKLYLFINSLFGLGNYVAGIAAASVIMTGLLNILAVAIWAVRQRAGAAVSLEVNDLVLFFSANFFFMNLSMSVLLLWAFKGAQNSRSQPKYLISEISDCEIADQSVPETQKLT